MDASFQPVLIMWFTRCLAVLLNALLANCAIPPAKLARVMPSAREQNLHQLISRALSDPETEAGKKALGTFIENWRRLGSPSQGVVVSPDDSNEAAYRVSFSGASPGTYPLTYFDEISPASDFDVKKIAHYLRAGAGVPMTAVRKNQCSERIEKFYPPELITRPLTALIEQGKCKQSDQDVLIKLLCPLIHDSVEVNGRPQQLAADFSVPWAAMLARAGKLQQRRVLDMIAPKPVREPRLYLMQPYDPAKEPLIMIHGLLSTPLIWANLSNELWADDTIRQRYQIWHYLYNTSAPALYSARILRQQLLELKSLLDPEGDDPAMRKTTLVTHSMGGLVGKALAVEPGEVFWKAAFTMPPEQLRMSAADRATLRDAFEWKADPSIHRIVFICTPHLGSGLADGFMGRVGSWLTRPPNPFREFYRRISSLNPTAFTLEYAELAQGKLDSVQSLSPRQPTLRLLSELPFAHPVTSHSIIGNRGKAGPVELSSDGVVPYLSSHLDHTVSELIVPSGHDAVKHSATIAEVKRILREP
jgi:pimeloyl-ACP methyl ester carboxylesterase